MKKSLLWGCLGVCSLAVVGAATVTTARYHTIADIPAPEKKDHLQVFLRGEYFTPGETYTFSAQNGDHFSLKASERGGLNGTYILPVDIGQKEHINLFLNQENQSRIDNESIAFSINVPARTVEWTGKYFLPENNISFSMTEHQRPKAGASGKTDWSGNFKQEVSFSGTNLIGETACFEEDRTNGKKLCLSFGIHKSPKLIQVVTLDPSVPGSGSDDPNSPFDKWIQPSNCSPYNATLSLCTNASSLQNDLAGTVYDMTRMTLQLSAGMMEQVGWIGTFFDARNQLRTQQLFWEKQEEAHSDYYPSEQMCAIASMTKELQNSEVRRELNTYGFYRALSYEDQNPAQHHTAFGAAEDYQFRIEAFRNNYCMPSNREGSLKIFCDGLSSGKFNRLNRDIDYTRLVDVPKTFDVDITDTDNPTADEEDLMNMGRLLFGHREISFPQPPTDAEAKDVLNDPNFAHLYQEYRSVSAIRNAARFSYANLIGMKTEGSGTSNLHIEALMKEFGMSDADIDRFIGENPSYFAQMQVLTKQLYQHPSFYTNLITKEANIDRFKASMAAIQLMAGRERFETLLRKEMLMSLLVEMKLRSVQGNIDTGLKLMESRLSK